MINYKALLDTVIESMIEEGEEQQVSFSVNDLFLSSLVAKEFSIILKANTENEDQFTTNFNIIVTFLKQVFLDENILKDSFTQRHQIVKELKDLIDDNKVTLMMIQNDPNKVIKYLFLNEG